jgi:hypothetical protein
MGELVAACSVATSSPIIAQINIEYGNNTSA